MCRGMLVNIYACMQVGVCVSVFGVWMYACVYV